MGIINNKVGCISDYLYLKRLGYRRINFAFKWLLEMK